MNRAFDILIAAALLAVLAPVIALAAAAIKVETRGTAFFRQRRVGRHGEPFELWKLRTMVTGAEGMGAGIYITPGDSRITRVGALLRRFSLDELPNLFNVLTGDLAIVGPRPTVQEQVDGYTPRQRRRLEVRPGITGWAQVNGRTSLPWPERIELDVWYVDHRCPRLDLQIVARTVRMLASGHGLYSEDPRQGWGTTEEPAPGAKDPGARAP
jgi:lipopolysaccharide/colanic/teichoic acid biosynthesis glycosyltransferase